MLEIMPADRLVNRTVNGATPFDESTRKLAIGGGIRVKVGVGLGATVAGRMAVGIGVGNRVLVGVGKTAMAVTTVGGSPVVCAVPPGAGSKVLRGAFMPRGVGVGAAAGLQATTTMTITRSADKRRGT